MGSCSVPPAPVCVTPARGPRTDPKWMWGWDTPGTRNAPPGVAVWPQTVQNTPQSPIGLTLPKRGPHVIGSKPETGDRAGALSAVPWGTGTDCCWFACGWPLSHEKALARDCEALGTWLHTNTRAGCRCWRSRCPRGTWPTSSPNSGFVLPECTEGLPVRWVGHGQDAGACLDWGGGLPGSTHPTLQVQLVSR